MLIGFKAQNHPQQTGPRGASRGDLLPGLGNYFSAAPVDLTDDVDDRAVPDGLFAQWQARFGFTVDVAANTHNAKLPRFYTKEKSGLEASWAGERVYCNPPFSDIGPWIEKAWKERDAAPLIVMLLPANRTEQAWWQTMVEPSRDRGLGFRTEFLAGRLKFLSPGEDEIRPNNRPPFGCCLLIWEEENC